MKGETIKIVKFYLDKCEDNWREDQIKTKEILIGV